MLYKVACHLRTNAIRAVRSVNQSTRRRASNNSKEDEPIKFSQSKAFDYNSADTFRSPQRNTPWYQPVSVLASTCVFLIYFCVLREESDWDQQVTEPLYSRMEGLEQKHLEQRIEFDKTRGKNTADFEARLEEVKSEK